METFNRLEIADKATNLSVSGYVSLWPVYSSKMDNQKDPISSILEWTGMAFWAKFSGFKET